MDPEQKYCVVYYKHKDKHHQVTISCDWHQFFVLQTCALEGRIRRIYLLSTHLAVLNRLTIEVSRNHRIVPLSTQEKGAI